MINHYMAINNVKLYIFFLKKIPTLKVKFDYKFGILYHFTLLTYKLQFIIWSFYTSYILNTQNWYKI